MQSSIYLKEAQQSVKRDEQFKRQYFVLYRVLEIIPGLLVWGSILGLILLAFVKPVWVAIFMLIYVTSWLLRAIRFSFYLLRAYLPFVRSMNTKWQAVLQADKQAFEKSKEVYHVILAATYKEEYETLARALDMLSKTTFPKEQIIFVLATEGRDHDNANQIANQLKKKYGSHFKDFIITEHPDGIEGEVKGKGTNISWAGRIVRDYIKKNKIDFKKTLVTSIDADHRLHPEYLSALTYKFVQDPDAEKSCYVSVALFFNNIWDVPSPVRFIHFSSSFWMMTTSVWTSRLHNVMTQTQTLSALVKTDFYSPSSIVEDGQQYWRSLFEFGPDYTVKMVLMPVYSDAVLTDSFWDTLKEQYLQRRRWHYGVSDFPYAMTHFLTEKKNRNFRVLVDILRHLDGHFSLATSSILLGIIGWVPILMTNVTQTVVGLNFQLYYSYALRFALIGLFLSAVLSIIIIPPKKENKKWSKLYVLWDYILVPIQIPLSVILAASVPSLDAHTRLMLGKEMGFRVTKKAVSTKTELLDS